MATLPHVDRLHGDGLLPSSFPVSHAAMCALCVRPAATALAFVLCVAVGSVDPTDKDEQLRYAAGTGDVDAVARLLKEGASVNGRSKDAATALMGAAWGGYPAVAKLLLDAGAAVNLKDNDGVTALMLTGGNPTNYVMQLKVAEMLLAAKVAPDSAAEDGRTALMFAAWNGHIDIVELLLAAGVDIDQTTGEGWTALMLAARNEQIAMTKYLIDRGANGSLRTKEGTTALQIMQLRADGGKRNQA